MDVLIKNFEMPKSCYSDEFKYCPFLFFDYDTKSHCGLSDDIRCTKTKRPKDCPLVELPPHGRLIDADELEGILDEVNGYGGASEITYKKMIEILHDETLSPTVLEAST